MYSIACGTDRAAVWAAWRGVARAAWRRRAPAWARPRCRRSCTRAERSGHTGNGWEQIRNTKVCTRLKQ